MQADIVEGLNEAQREAVEAVRGPVAILAGAGTGKTTTITRRIAWQVASAEFDPGQILAVTFTQKAAREMGARLGRLGVAGVRAMTFHAEALAQFRRFAPEQPDILASKGQILHSIAQRLPMPYRFMPLRDLAGEIEWAKNRRIPARDYLEKLGEHETPIPRDLMHRIYVNYEARKRKAGMMDFEDLLERLIGVLEGDSRALGVVRSRYAAFTVDEYQDVNLLQQTLLDAWVGARDDVCVVGDDYQSIFGFTGASAQHLLRFPDRWDHTTVVTLTENYRSTPEILTVANRLVPLLGGTRKTLRATRDTGPNPTIRRFDTGDEEVAWIVREARGLHETGTPWEEIAILYRINGRSEDFEEAFARAGVPYQVRDGSFLSRPAARAFLARGRRAAGPGGTVAEAVREIIESLGYDPAGKYEGGEESTRQADLERLLALAGAFEGEDMAAFVQDLRARFTPEAEGRGVQLMTYHRAKGLEFDVVFLPRLEDKEMPFALAKNDADVAEERRLLYVGITRARRVLSLSYAALRPSERRSKPRSSPFLAELTQRAGAGPPSAKGTNGRPASSSDKRGAHPGRQEDRQPESPLLGALKVWRKDEATKAGLPAYVVFHDKTLEEIAQKRPDTPAALREIAGVGPLKMQRYGDCLLAIISNAPQGPDVVRATG
ncbi:MAG TPA: ATP-dependent DNA helicase UvrD2 [Actinomycetota bacterium]